MKNFIKTICAVLALVVSATLTTVYSVKADNDKQTAVEGVSVTLTDGIAVRYTVNVPEGVNSATMEFSYLEKKYSVEKDNLVAGKTEFIFDEISPQYMSEEVNYVLYFNGVENERSTESFSFEKYAKKLLGKTAGELNQTTTENDSMKKLLVDTLYYGKAAAAYKKSTGGDVTSGLSDDEKAFATTFAGIETTDKKIEGDGVNYFKTAGLSFADKVGVYFTFAGDFAKDDEIKIEIEKNGEKTNITEFEQSDNVYTAVYEDITLLEFDTPIKATLYLNGEKINKTVTYSVKSNVYAFSNSEEKPEFAELVKRVYNYGLSAKAYKAACSAPFSYTVEAENVMNWWESKAFNPSQENFVNCIIDKTGGWESKDEGGEKFIAAVEEKYITLCVNSEIEGDVVVKLNAASAEVEKHVKWVPLETKVVDLSSAYTLSYGINVSDNTHTTATILSSASVGGDKTDNESGDVALFRAWCEVEIATIHFKQGENFVRLTRKKGGGTGINVKSVSFEFIR